MKKRSIYCIQDFHCTDKTKNIIEAEWGYTCVLSTYKSYSRGTAILFNNNFEFKIHKTTCDKEGNYVVIDLEFRGRRTTIITIYGPNRDNPDFYEGISEIIRDYENASIILCGDWNMVQEFKLDTSGYKQENNLKAKKRSWKSKRNLN